MRVLETVSWPPQGKVPSLSSSKPRAAGKLRLKWAVVSEVRAARARRLDDVCIVLCGLVRKVGSVDEVGWLVF